MNLYILHNKPETLKNYDVCTQYILNMIDHKTIYQRNSEEFHRNIDENKFVRFILHSPILAYQLADTLYYYNNNKHMFERYKHVLETSIARDGLASCFYSQNILKKAFPKGEPAILEDATNCYRYAIYSLGARFIAGEPIIAEYIKDDYYLNPFSRIMHLSYNITFKVDLIEEYYGDLRVIA
jgi:hypothetical protein